MKLYSGFNKIEIPETLFVCCRVVKSARMTEEDPTFDLTKKKKKKKKTNFDPEAEDKPEVGNILSLLKFLGNRNIILVKKNIFSRAVARRRLL